MDRDVFQDRFGLIGESPAIRQVMHKIVQVAATDISVLLQGESGVGKDVVAKAIHGLSTRKHKPLVVVNCGAIPEGIIESELFGHEKGSFTGAHETRKGYFEKADGGTIFLDEIADTPKNIQVKLLRVLESGEFFRVGSAEVRTTNVRVIAASNKDLIGSVNEGAFREDLYYRLNTVTIRIPPLRERAEDVLLIFRKFVQEFAAKYDSVFQGFSDEARHLLVSYRWPGNIRELRNVAEQLVVLEKSKFITPEILSPYLSGRQKQGNADHLPALFGNIAQPGTAPSSQDNEWLLRVLVELLHEVKETRQMVGMLMTQPSNAVPRNPLQLPPPVWGNSGNSDQLREVPLGVQSIPEAEISSADKDEEGFGFTANGSVPSLDEVERHIITRALKQFEGNRRRAAEALGISERTLYRKIDQYGL